MSKIYFKSDTLCSLLVVSSLLDHLSQQSLLLQKMTIKYLAREELSTAKNYIVNFRDTQCLENRSTYATFVHSYPCFEEPGLQFFHFFKVVY